MKKLLAKLLPSCFSQVLNKTQNRKSEIYLDNNASTFLCQEALEAFQKCSSLVLNASSQHAYGRQAKALLSQAQRSFASYLKCKEENILFTSSATEAINTFLLGLSAHKYKNRIISCTSEHAATLETLKKMKSSGYRIDLVPIDKNGHIDLEELRKRMSSDVRALVFMAANNETGTLHPIEEMAKIATEFEALFFVDAVAAATKVPLVMYKGLSAMALSAHKFHGPPGVGVLALNLDETLSPLIVGGLQQNSLRGGTLSIPLAESAAKAFEIGLNPSFAIYIQKLRDTFEELLLQDKCVEVNGSSNRVCNVSNLYFKGIDAESLLIYLDQKGIFASHGSACQAGASELSHVLLAMHSRERAKSSLRFSFSRLNTLEEIKQAASYILTFIRESKIRLK